MQTTNRHRLEWSDQAESARGVSLASVDRATAAQILKERWTGRLRDHEHAIGVSGPGNPTDPAAPNTGWTIGTWTAAARAAIDAL